MAGYTQAEINNWGTMRDPFIFANTMKNIPMADPWATQNATVTTTNLEGTPTGLTPQVNNVSTRSIGDFPNVLNAGATALFSGLATFLSGWSSSKIYDLYAQQEQLYIENAQEQAKRLKIKGEFALANLRSKHAIAEGTNELAVAGAGAGSISGSFLDKLMANRKYDTRSELSQGYETLWAVKNAERNGLLQAYSTAGQAYSRAIQQRNKAVSGLFAGLARGIGSILADMRQEDATQSTIYADQMKQDYERWRNATYYSNKMTDRAGLELETPRGEAQISSGIINLEGNGQSLIFNEIDNPTIIQEAIYKEVNKYNAIQVFD